MPAVLVHRQRIGVLMIFTAFIFITILLFHYHGNREHDESYVDVVHDHYGNTDYHDNHHNHLNDDKVTEENDDEDNDGNRDDEMSRSRGILYPLEVKDKDIWQRISDMIDLKDERYKSQHAFNQFISKEIGFARELPDTRPQKCPTMRYPPVKDLPTTSVIICFHNEDFVALLRTVYTVLLRSPPQLIKEIILVDDASTLPDLKSSLQLHIDDYLPKVSLLRANVRQGLIRARILGAKVAKGDVLTFLDSHCEVNVGWVEPLLARLKEKPHSGVMPLIEIINSDTLQYQPVGINLGGFTWDFLFSWDQISENSMTAEERARPRASPTMAGGLFSIYRNFFFKIGSYDQLMDVWGGENLEISFRLWMCAGGIELIPCSRVGHIFRGRRPYSSPGGDSFGRNTIRLAEVWMDNYKEALYIKRPHFRKYEVGDLEERRSLREKLNCHSFEWYLKNIYPKGLENLQKDSSLRDLNL